MRKYLLIIMALIVTVVDADAVASQQNILGQAKRKAAATTKARQASQPSAKKTTSAKATKTQAASPINQKMQAEGEQVSTPKIILPCDSIIRDTVSQQQKPSQQDSYDKVFSNAMVEQKASFPGGEAAMYAWLSRNVTYPCDEDVQGKVLVKFVVDRDGHISNVRVMRGKHPALDAEAVRVVKRMPKWTPARLNGKPVRVDYVVPITFRLH